MHDYAFVTVCDDIYSKYLKTFIKSILKHNKKFDIPFYVIVDVDKISINTVRELNDIYEFEYLQSNQKIYKKYDKMRMTYRSFECFNPDHFSNYNNVVYFGSDVLCLKNMKELFKLKVPKLGLTKEQRRIKTYNNNCMIVNNSLITKENYHSLLSNDYSKNNTAYGTDQKSIQLYFKNQIKEIPQKFNTLVSETDFIDFKDIVFLHYIYKPDLEQGIKHLDKKLIMLWKKYGK